MKCANCGNEDPKKLFDEGDTFYCSICHHRTQTATGLDDLITCPYCGRPRDRKASDCWWCNNSLDSFPRPSRKEYEEINKILDETEKQIDASDPIYGKLLGKRKKFGEK